MNLSCGSSAKYYPEQSLESSKLSEPYNPAVLSKLKLWHIAELFVMPFKKSSNFAVVVTVTPSSPYPQKRLKFISRQGSKKVPSGRTGQVHFLAGQVTFIIHLPNGQGSKQVI